MYPLFLISSVVFWRASFSCIYQFDRSVAFNTDISKWNVQSCQDFDSMFANTTTFNVNISSWNVRQARYMGNMFQGSSAFVQNLCAWGVQLSSLATVDVANMFRNSSCPVTSDPQQANGPWCTVCA
jgi:Mycoplasma protein of unknown function, DUF285